MIKAILIDDERNALDVLEMQLQQYCTGVEVIDICDSGEKGIRSILKHKPDLVFLDIEMPHKNGFDVIQATKEENYEVIFTTAYDQFAIRAFKVSAVDYLLKPIDILELREAVEKVKGRSNDDALDKKVEAILKNLKPIAPLVSKIALPVGEAIQLFEANEIVRCESDSNYSHIYLENGKKIIVAKTLKDVEESIGGNPFYRIHQSHYININHVNKVVKGESAYVVMKDGTTITISRNKKEAFLESFRKV
jgi:two-component system LytT family response regulator